MWTLIIPSSLFFVAVSALEYSPAETAPSVASKPIPSTSLAEAFVFPAYCAKPNADFIPLRTPPKLTKQENINPQLIQVSALLRHGARAPAAEYQCWPDYKAEWNCGVRASLTGSVFNDTVDGDVMRNHADLGIDPVSAPSLTQPNLQSYAFVKNYDVSPQSNAVRGTCAKGQLVAEGYQQAEIMGSLLAQAYQVPSSELSVLGSSHPALLSKDKFRDEIYFRSSDAQRTIMTGGVFLTSFFKSAGFDLQGDSFPVHTIDEEKEYLFPNVNVCPRLGSIRERMFASSAYQEFNAKYKGLRLQLAKIIGPEYIEEMWPADLFECLMTTLCSEKVSAIPSELRPNFFVGNDDEIAGSDEPKPLLDRVIDAVNDYADFEYTWRSAVFSQTAISQFMVEFKAEILRAVLKDLGEKYDDQNVSKVLQSLLSTQALQDFYQYINANSTRSKNALTPLDAKKLVVYTGHDTTILPFLSSLGNSMHDGTWPPYASELLFELYSADDNYYFRLIYNGVPLTSRIKGCGVGPTRELCNLNLFFMATSWATPSEATKACTVPSDD